MSKNTRPEADRLMAALGCPEAPKAEIDASLWSPAFDIKETGKEFVVYVDIPGVDEDDISVCLEEGGLTISGAREFDHDNEDAEEFTRLGRRYGAFKCHLQLASNINFDGVSAKYKRGVLKVKLPKCPGDAHQGISVVVH